MSLDPWGYQEFFRGSRAEWTVAKDQNVRLRSGWFSERDACYLASGKPVIAQSTGFEKFLPTRRGALRLPDDGRHPRRGGPIESDYPKACRAARAVAEEPLEATERVPPLRRGHRPVRFLIVNADDFGYGAGVNRGIVEAHDRGVVTSAGLMVNTPGTEEAVRLAAERPGLSLGLHVNFTNEAERLVEFDDPAVCRRRAAAPVRPLRRPGRAAADPPRLAPARPSVRPCRCFQELAKEHGVPLRDAAAGRSSRAASTPSGSTASPTPRR